MYSDPMPETNTPTGDALSPLHSNPSPKEMTMNRYCRRFENFWARLASFAAAFATSTTLLLAVLGAFYSVSSAPVLADSPQARSAVAGCDAHGARRERQHCVQHLVVRAQAQDAGASQLAALAAHQRGAGP